MTTSKFTFTLRPTTMDSIDKYAKELQRSKSSVVEEALREWIDAHYYRPLPVQKVKTGVVKRGRT